ncbi:MAG TPA: serine/threonine protein kinase [Planctomycetes bacterium]|nr:serine/threonine protein kinase [Planctomycetota bacterium]HIK59495.1 serine/threonine protein kinase [Planctomycetota bacterium]
MSSHDEENFHDYLGAMFLRDVGMDAGTPPPMTDEGFVRAAVELDLVDPTLAERVLKDCGEGQANRVWKVLEDEGVLDVSDVLRVFRHQGDVEALGGRSVGRYLLIEVIGEGAWGRVYRAIHQDLLKHVALKVLPETPATTRARIERFHREASTAARLGHKHIVGVHDVGVEGHIHFIAMDLVEGQNLDVWAEGKDPVQRLEVMAKVARAIGYAHQHGVLHRDLKPANILVGADGEPTVVDFGLARAIEDERITVEGALLGTPMYMAPEQERGEMDAVDARADVFALGVILAELMEESGGTDGVESSQAMRLVIQRCTQAEAIWRYPQGDALAEDLERILAGESVAFGGPGILARMAFGVRQRPGRAISLFVGLALMSLALWWGFEIGERNRRLQHATSIQGAYHQLQASLEPLLLEAETLRYTDLELDDRSSLLTSADSLIAQAGDTSGVGEAYRCWIGWLVGEAGVEDRLAEARRSYPDNPFPHLVQSWVHLRRYTELAEWPGADQGITMERVRTPVQLLQPREIEAMRLELDAVGGALQEARRARVWEQVGGLKWVEDLCAGFEAYARGDYSEAARLISTVSAHADLPVEANLVLAFSHCQENDVESAFAALRHLLAKRPQHVVALRALATCHRERAQRAIRLGEDGRQDVLDAMEITRGLSDDPEHDPSLAMLALHLYFAEMMLGEDGSATLDRAWLANAAALEAAPDDYRLLANRAQMRLQLIKAGDDRYGDVHAALEDLESAREIHGDDYTIDVMVIGARIMALKAARGGPEGEESDASLELARLIDRMLENWGPDGQLYYYRASLAMLRISALGSSGEATLPLYQSALEDCRAALARDAEFQDARFMSLWLSFFLPPELALPDEEVLALESDLRERAYGKPLDANWEHYLAGGFEREARSRAGEAIALDYAMASARAHDQLVGHFPLDPRRRLAAGRSHLRVAGHDPEGMRLHLGQAQEYLDTASQQDPDHPQAWRWLALCFSVMADTGGGPAHSVAACERLAGECIDRALQAGDDSMAMSVVFKRCEIKSGSAPPFGDPAERLDGDIELRETLALMRAGATRSLLDADLGADGHRVALELVEWLQGIEGPGAVSARLVALGLHRLGEGEAALAACSALAENDFVTLVLRSRWAPETLSEEDAMRLKEASEEQLGVIAGAVRE